MSFRDNRNGINNCITGKEMKMLNSDNSRGFTLVEVLVALVISTFIIAAVFMATITGQQAASGIEQKIAVQQDVRAALDMMAMEISMASYTSVVVDRGAVAWLNPTCSGAGVAANRGIQQATANALTVEMDIFPAPPNAPNGILTDPNEIITYSYTANQIFRNTNCSGNQLFIGGNNVQVVNAESGTPVFQYFDGNNIATANVPDIRRIVITLEVRSIAADLRGQRRTMVYSTSVIPRNHVMSIQ
jgi:type IV pilus assembly protein PilW